MRKPFFMVALLCFMVMPCFAEDDLVIEKSYKVKYESIGFEHELLIETDKSGILIGEKNDSIYIPRDVFIELLPLFKEALGIKDAVIEHDWGTWGNFNLDAIQANDVDCNLEIKEDK